MADKRDIDMLRFYGGDIRKRTEDGKFLIMNSLKNPRDQKDLLWGDENDPPLREPWNRSKNENTVI